LKAVLATARGMAPEVVLSTCAVGKVKAEFAAVAPAVATAVLTVNWVPLMMLVMIEFAGMLLIAAGSSSPTTSPAVLETVAMDGAVAELTVLALIATIGATPRLSWAEPDFTKFMPPPMVSTNCEYMTSVPLLAYTYNEAFAAVPAV